jgi:hypothetical protein
MVDKAVSRDLQEAARTLGLRIFSGIERGAQLG